MRMARVCIVIPAYNEAAAIARTIAEHQAAFPDADLLVVDNNSTDGTRDIALKAGLPGRLRVVSEPRQGKGFAVKTGLSLADADIYVLTDGDLTYRAADARRLLD